MRARGPRPGASRTALLILLGLPYYASAWRIPSAVRTARSCGRLQMSATESETTNKELSQRLRQSGEGSRALAVGPLFETMAVPDSPFMNEFWQKKPFVSDPADGVASLKGAWTMKDVSEAVSQEFLTAGRGTFDEGRGGWKMAEVGKARGSSFEEAKLHPEDVLQAMNKKSGTVVFNSAGTSVGPLASVCLDATEAFQLPVAINLYLTAAGQVTSAPPHTDKQDVFVLQTQGRKHWRVYAPPTPGRKPGASPFARGKDKDTLSLEELGPPLIDTVLEPGQVLYMPSAFPHTTDTVQGIASSEASAEPSVHLTLGVDSHIWGLTFATLREYVLRRLGEDADEQPPASMADSSVFIGFNEALPLGCMEAKYGPPPKRWSEARAALVDRIVAEFLVKVRAVEPERELWNGEDASVIERTKLVEVVGRLIDHHRKMVSLFREMYRDVAFRLTDVQRDLSFFRSRPYLQAIEAEMQSLVDWVGGPPKAAAAAEGGKAAGPAKGGFSKGGGGGKKKTASSKGFGAR